jgi:non-ribosomal peptide synthase protein (TIGR01720 family)
LTFEAFVHEGRFQLHVGYSADIHREATIEALADRYIRNLEDLIQHCIDPAAHGSTPSDFPLANLSQGQLDSVLARIATTGE